MSDHIKMALTRWGRLARSEIDGGTFPATREASLMLHGIKINRPWRPDGIHNDDRAIDIDRAVSALPEKLKRVLVAEYVQSGSYRQKAAIAGMSKSAYYRNLEKAINALAQAGNVS